MKVAATAEVKKTEVPQDCFSEMTIFEYMYIDCNYLNSLLYLTLCQAAECFDCEADKIEIISSLEN